MAIKRIKGVKPTVEREVELTEAQSLLLERDDYLSSFCMPIVRLACLNPVLYNVLLASLLRENGNIIGSALREFFFAGFKYRLSRYDQILGDNFPFQYGRTYSDLNGSLSDSVCQPSLNKVVERSLFPVESTVFCKGSSYAHCLKLSGKEVAARMNASSAGSAKKIFLNSIVYFLSSTLFFYESFFSRYLAALNTLVTSALAFPLTWMFFFTFRKAMEVMPKVGLALLSLCFSASVNVLLLSKKFNAAVLPGLSFFVFSSFLSYAALLYVFPSKLYRYSNQDLNDLSDQDLSNHVSFLKGKISFYRNMHVGLVRIMRVLNAALFFYTLFDFLANSSWFHRPTLLSERVNAESEGGFSAVLLKCFSAYGMLILSFAPIELYQDFWRWRKDRKTKVDINVMHSSLETACITEQIDLNFEQHNLLEHSYFSLNFKQGPYKEAVLIEAVKYALTTANIAFDHYGKHTLTVSLAKIPKAQQENVRAAYNMFIQRIDDLRDLSVRCIQFNKNTTLNVQVLGDFFVGGDDDLPAKRVRVHFDDVDNDAAAAILEDLFKTANLSERSGSFDFHVSITSNDKDFNAAITALRELPKTVVVEQQASAASALDEDDSDSVVRQRKEKRRDAAVVEPEVLAEKTEPKEPVFAYRGPRPIFKVKGLPHTWACYAVRENQFQGNNKILWNQYRELVEEEGKGRFGKALVGCYERMNGPGGPALFSKKLRVASEDERVYGRRVEHQGREQLIVFDMVAGH